MRRDAGFSLMELMVWMGVASAILGLTLVLSGQATADSRHQRITQTVLAVASVATAQAEYEGLGAAGGSAESLASRSSDLAPMLSADRTYFDAGNGVIITPTTGTITVTGLDPAACVDVATALGQSIPGIAGVRVNATTGPFIDPASKSAVLTACRQTSPASVRVDL